MTWFSELIAPTLLDVLQSNGPLVRSPRSRTLCRKVGAQAPPALLTRVAAAQQNTVSLAVSAPATLDATGRWSESYW